MSKKFVMQYSVIYEVDVPLPSMDREWESDADLTPPDPCRWAPPVVRRWERTEGDEQSDQDGGRHRKWTGLLTQKQFDRFVEKCGLTAEDCETMGSLGAPGFGFGWAPAVAFRGCSDDCDQCAYVTPLPEPPPAEPLGEKEWRALRKKIIARYG